MPDIARTGVSGQIGAVIVADEGEIGFGHAVPKNDGARIPNVPARRAKRSQCCTDDADSAVVRRVPSWLLYYLAFEQLDLVVRAENPDLDHLLVLVDRKQIRRRIHGKCRQMLYISPSRRSSGWRIRSVGSSISTRV